MDDFKTIGLHDPESDYRKQVAIARMLPHPIKTLEATPKDRKLYDLMCISRWDMNDDDAYFDLKKGDIVLNRDIGWLRVMYRYR